MASTSDFAIIKLNDNFDIKKFNVENFQMKTSKNKKFEWYTSDLTYDGKEFYLQIGDQGTSGFYIQYEFGKEECVENQKGYQVSYDMTSDKTVKNPTDYEKITINRLQQIYDKVFEMFEKFAKNDDFPESAASALGTRTFKRQGPTAALKPLFAHKTKKEGSKKIILEDEPQRMYLPLMVNGKGGDMVVASRIYGRGDKLHDFKKDPLGLARGGKLSETFLKFSHVYWGSHGSKSTHGGSIKAFLAETNFSVNSGRNSLPSFRMGSKNKDQVLSSSDNDDDNGSDGDYEAPNFDNSDDDDDNKSPGDFLYGDDSDDDDDTEVASSSKATPKKRSSRKKSKKSSK